MKVTFVSPALAMSGGNKVIATYAKGLQDLGHDVMVVAPAHRRKRTLSTLLGRNKPGRIPSHLDEAAVELRIVDHATVSDADVPDADVVVATWWATAEWVDGFSSQKGAKAYFVQHYELFSYLPEQRVRATYRMPMHKIVIARWLADVMRDEYGDHDVDIVPNSVDHRQFFAPVRGRQPVPTIGTLFSSADWKRFALAMEAVVRVRTRIPNLRLVCFGSEPPMPGLPDFVSFAFRPAQESIRDLYASCDVWLTASCSEGFNLPAMEAMACRTPVVATRTGWPAEAVIDGFNGACVEIDDVDALARETERVLCLPDADWRALSEGAFATVRDSSWDQSTSLFVRALGHAVQRGSESKVPLATSGRSTRSGRA